MNICAFPNSDLVLKERICSNGSTIYNDYGDLKFAIRNYHIDDPVFMTDNVGLKLCWPKEQSGPNLHGLAFHLYHKSKMFRFTTLSVTIII